MRKRVSIPLIVLCAAILAVCLYCKLSLDGIGGALQYVYPAPKPVTVKIDDSTEITSNAGLIAARKTAADVAADLPDGGAATMYAVCDPATVETGDTDEKQTAICRLEAQQDGIYAVRPATLLAGRLIYPDEFKYGSRVAILDEGLAVALFKYAEPIDRLVYIAEREYRIVGVLRAGKRVGDHQEYRCYVPYRSLEDTELQLTALTFEMLPERTSGAYNALKQTVSQLSEEGTLISLPKERMNAAMPLRVLVFAAGCALAFIAIRWLLAIAKRRYVLYKERIKVKYFIRLLPWLIWQVLPVMLGLAACAVALGYLFIMILDPVFTFPEWVPAVLVEPKDIATSFWNVWQSSATITEYRSPELLRARFFGTLTGWSCGAAAIALGIIIRALGKRNPKKGSVQDDI